MPVLSGSFPVRRYSVSGTLPSPFWDSLQGGMTANAYTPPLSANWSGTRVGLVTVDNLLDADFNDRKWMADPYVFAALRIDTKSAPAALVKAEYDRRLKAWRAEFKSAHVPRDVRKDIKEAVTEEVLAQTSARTKVVDFVWNTSENWVTLGHLSDGIADQFVRTFRQTTGLTLTPWSPFGEEVPVDMPGDFYLWLWWALDAGELDNVSDASVDGKIVLKGRGSETSCTGEDVNKHPEPRTAVMSGKRPTVMKLRLSVDDLAFSFTMNGPELHISSLKLPEGETSSRVDREAAILDRLGAYERLHAVVAEWASGFRSFYNTKAYHEWVQNDLTPWIQPKV